MCLVPKCPININCVITILLLNKRNGWVAGYLKLGSLSIPKLVFETLTQPFDKLSMDTLHICYCAVGTTPSRAGRNDPDTKVTTSVLLYHSPLCLPSPKEGQACPSLLKYFLASTATILTKWPVSSRPGTTMPCFVSKLGFEGSLLIRWQSEFIQP